MVISEKFKEHIRQALENANQGDGIVEADGDWSEGDDYFLWKADACMHYVNDYIGDSEVGYHDEGYWELYDIAAYIEKLDDDGSVIESMIWKE